MLSRSKHEICYTEPLGKCHWILIETSVWGFKMQSEGVFLWLDVTPMTSMWEWLFTFFVKLHVWRDLWCFSFTVFTLKGGLNLSSALRSFSLLVTFCCQSPPVLCPLL